MIKGPTIMQANYMGSWILITNKKLHQCSNAVSIHHVQDDS